MIKQNSIDEHSFSLPIPFPPTIGNRVPFTISKRNERNMINVRNIEEAEYNMYNICLYIECGGSVELTATKSWLNAMLTDIA